MYNREYQKILLADIAGTAIDKSVYKPYIFGTTISFARGGNSAEYINISDGWGGQEDLHRCAVGKTSVIRLYIPDGAHRNLRLTVNGFGVWNQKLSDAQQITVYANDTQLAIWQVGGVAPYSVIIPDYIMADNTLVLRFVAAQPHSPPPDKRKLSMAVRNIVIDKVYGATVKRQIGIWIKDNLMDGGVPQTFDTDVVADEDWS